MFYGSGYTKLLGLWEEFSASKVSPPAPFPALLPRLTRSDVLVHGGILAFHGAGTGYDSHEGGAEPTF